MQTEVHTFELKLLYYPKYIYIYIPCFKYLAVPRGVS